MALKLNRSEVADKFVAAFDIDQKIIVPGLYQGPLSNITLTAANRLMRSKSNLLIEKNPVMKTKEKVAAAKRVAKENTDE